MTVMWAGGGTERAAASRRGVRRATPLLMLLLLTAAGCAGTAGTGPTTGPVPAEAVPERVTEAEAVAVFDTAWVRIHRTYYDTTFRGVDWEGVRAELRPLAREAGTADSLRAILADMIGRLGDSHFAVIPAGVADALDPAAITGADGEPGDVGVELRIVDDALVVVRVREGSPAEGAGVGPGWVLESIDGEPSSARLEALDQLGEHRRLAEARLAWAAESVLAGTAGDTVVAGFRDGDGVVVERTMVSVPRPGTPVRFGNLPTQFATLEHQAIPVEDGCVGLIRFNIWMTPILPAFDDAFGELRHCQGMVLDIRGNPGGVGGMVMTTSGYFMEERKPLGRMLTRNAELNLVSMPRHVNRTGGAIEPFTGPVAILIDGQSMSTSEIFAGGMQGIGRARLFGETTGAQALPALMERLPNNDVLMYVFANYVGPDGTRIEGRGVHPDQEVPLRRTDLLQGIDAPLEAAIHWIREQGPEPR